MGEVIQTPEELLRKLARAGRHTPGCTIIISWGDAGCDCGADNEMHHLCQEVRELVGDLQDEEHDFQRALKYADCQPCIGGAIPVLTPRMVTWEDQGETKSGEIKKWIHPGFVHPEGGGYEKDEPYICMAHRFHEERMKPKAEEGEAGGGQ